MDLPVTIREHFSSLGAAGPSGGPLAELVALLSAGTFTKADRHRILKKAGVRQNLGHRKAELDLLLSYLQDVADAHSFGVEQRKSFDLLKELFEVSEGEFLQHRPVELATLLNAQLERILEDDIIDPAEDESQAELQDALDLGFDQYMALCRRAFETASERLRALAQSDNTATRREAERRLTALAPLIRLAEAQQRTLGALY